MTNKMPRKLKSQDALAKRRLQQKLCNRRRYNRMKNDPEMLEIEKMKRRQRYLEKKEARKEKSSHAQREQRKKWRENSKRYRQRKKEEAVEEEKLTSFETIHVQALADSDHSEAEEPDVKLDNPLPHCPQIQAEVMKVRYAELRKRKKILRIIATLRERVKSQRKYIQKLERKLIQMRAMFSPHEPQLDGDDSASEERESPIIMENVIKFYSEDANSVKRTGKNKITRNEERNQKRYLRLPLIVYFITAETGKKSVSGRVRFIRVQQPPFTEEACIVVFSTSARKYDSNVNIDI